ncbi:hypothetical protein Avbf_02871 [Armadillidium vulgare]|nr:hypothetical protein Avbf_02871 [Armadillidium vulgare]
MLYLLVTPEVENSNKLSAVVVLLPKSCLPLHLTLGAEPPMINQFAKRVVDRAGKTLTIRNTGEEFDPSPGIIRKEWMPGKANGVLPNSKRPNGGKKSCLRGRKKEKNSLTGS